MSSQATPPQLSKPQLSKKAERQASTPAELLSIDQLSLWIRPPAVDDRRGRKTAENQILDGVSLSVGRGETVGLVGESGSGKSLTALSVLGLLPPGSRTAGAISLEGTQLLGAKNRMLRTIRGNRVGMVFQDPLSSLNPFYSVGDQIAEAYRIHRGGSRRAAMAVAADAMETVHIRDAHRRVHDYPHQFSGGMRQRIMIAMAIVCQPDLIIADEPTTALDVTVQAQILQLLAELQQRSNAGILLITHDLAVVSQVADRLVVLQRGRVVEQGSTEAIFTHPQDPYTAMLLDATPRMSGPMPTLPTPGEQRQQKAVQP